MTNNKVKLTLSAKEQELVCTTEWILTKQIIIEKIIALFSGLLVSMQKIATTQKSNLPEEVFATDPKIARGENYKGLPYIMLDYPRYFKNENTIAIRTLFWWGNFISLNLQLSGKIKNDTTPNLLAHFSMLQQNDYWICTNNHPWDHYFGEGNYLPIQEITKAQFTILLNKKSFVKIGKKISLQHHDTVTQFVEQTFEEMLLLIQNQLPNR